MNLRSALLAATVMALPLAAKAQPVTGIYVGAGAGYNILTNVTVKEGTYGATSGAAAYGGTLKAEGGFVGKASVGWGFGNGLRAELEGNFYSNKFNMGSFYGPGVSAGGFEYKFGGLVNALYDFYWLSPYVQPYLGVGAGYEGVKWDNVRAYAPGSAIGTSSSETKGSFAYQGIAGVAFPIASIPGFAITAEYDFLGLAGTRSYGAGYYIASTPGHPGSVGTGTIKAQNDYNHSFLLGVRYNFGVAPPPPPPPVVAPAPAPARSYLVFFDWDKYNLTDRARAIIHEAAVNSTKVQYTKIQVNGYTDTSGTPQYNMGLSIRRANAVAAELVKDGVPKNVIAIQGFGETHLLVPTGPGVREPQNRRVEIIIQ
jgi:outer membrane protein OmpA-like peptidoglycan-associated protein